MRDWKLESDAQRLCNRAVRLGGKLLGQCAAAGSAVGRASLRLDPKLLDDRPPFLGTSTSVGLVLIELVGGVDREEHGLPLALVRPELLARSEISVPERATANSCKLILALKSATLHDLTPIPELANSTELGSHLEIFL